MYNCTFIPITCGPADILEASSCVFVLVILRRGPTVGSREVAGEAPEHPEPAVECWDSRLRGADRPGSPPQAQATYCNLAVSTDCCKRPEDQPGGGK